MNHNTYFTLPPVYCVGPLATQLRCDGIFKYDFCCQCITEFANKKTLKIGYNLAKFRTKVFCLAFLTHGV